MTILVINEFYKCAGAEVVANRQRSTLEQCGHDVYEMIFHASEDCGNNTIVVQCSSLNRHVYNPFLAHRIKRIISKISPDRIIVHNVISAPFAVCNSLKEYKAVQVVHDFGIICPIYDCVYG